MSVYSGPELIRLIAQSKAVGLAGWQGGDRADPFIDLTPYDEKMVGPNSIDVHLGNELRVYYLEEVVQKYGDLYRRPYNVAAAMEADPPPEECLMTEVDNPTRILQIPKDGFMLKPGVLYLGTTVEKTVCCGVVPWLDGRSSLGRLGVQIHSTAGRGDDGFGEQNPGGCTWTLEISVVHPVWIRQNERIGQLTFFEMIGARKPYVGRYSKQDGPTSSKMHEPGAVASFLLPEEKKQASAPAS